MLKLPIMKMSPPAWACNSQKELVPEAGQPFSALYLEESHKV
jgi:hypothetical protein